jgi:hypothetical protein
MGSVHCPIQYGYTSFYEKEAKYFLHLKPFGELLVTINQKKLNVKSDNRGTIDLYLGRFMDHSPDCVRIFAQATQQVILSKDVTLMNKFYNDDLCNYVQ